jgi:carotenoid cleavage dioxygenase-like enzyme
MELVNLLLLLLLLLALCAGGGDYSKVRHMFDGYGFLSRLRVAGGRAWGNQRYVQSKAFKAYTAQGQHP